MLRTALRPKWLGLLVVCLLVASGFVWLSQWQFSRSVDEAPTTQQHSETSVPLSSHFKPGQDMLQKDADQVVTVEGHYIPETQALVENRLYRGETGYWVIQGFAVDGEEDVMPVVRGWQPSKTKPPEATSAENVTITGRLMPSEAPQAEGRAADLGEFPVLKDVSAARLANMWEEDAYAGFVVAFSQAPDDLTAGSDGLRHVHVAPGYQEESKLNWLNIFYGVEWVVFAGFAVFVWWRLVRDEYRQDQKFEAELAAWQARQDARVAQAQKEAHARHAATSGADHTVVQQDQRGASTPESRRPDDAE